MLTKLLERENTVQGDRFYGLINPKLVAAYGWSAGGYAAIALASGDDTVWDYGLTDPYARSLDPPFPRMFLGRRFPTPGSMLVGLDAATKNCGSRSWRA
ncbi:MAG: hypothetical protein MZV65_53090 [Chromatiales bacterium]|nr:hypothetical protein [Chromatiales bacterium]